MQASGMHNLSEHDPAAAAFARYCGRLRGLAAAIGDQDALSAQFAAAMASPLPQLPLQRLRRALDAAGVAAATERYVFAAEVSEVTAGNHLEDELLYLTYAAEQFAAVPNPKTGRRLIPSLPSMNLSDVQIHQLCQREFLERCRAADRTYGPQECIDDHQRLICQAIDRGDEVPQRVLADYPELRSRQNARRQCSRPANFNPVRKSKMYGSTMQSRSAETASAPQLAALMAWVAQQRRAGASLPGDAEIKEMALQKLSSDNPQQALEQFKKFMLTTAVVGAKAKAERSATEQEFSAELAESDVYVSPEQIRRGLAFDWGGIG